MGIHNETSALMMSGLNLLDHLLIASGTHILWKADIKDRSWMG